MTASDTPGHPVPAVAFIGYGEAARAFASGWRGSVAPTMAAYDIKTDGPADVRAAKMADYGADGMSGHPTLSAAIAAGDVVFSLVTAGEALSAARSAAQGGLAGKLFFDCNSCAPQTKTQSCDVIEAAGGRYVDVAVMAPVHPKLHRSPLLVSGPHVQAALDVLAALDMNATEAPGPVGTASGIKLCRSIAVKGLEALSAEMLTTARRLGVEQPVLNSLDVSYPGFDWVKRGTYALDRMMVHGRRRSEEMAEAARMVSAAGLPNGIAAATADWQAKVGNLGIEPGSDDLADRTDALLARLSDVNGETNG